jgi:hypothetical protein
VLLRGPVDVGLGAKSEIEEDAFEFTEVGAGDLTAAQQFLDDQVVVVTAQVGAYLPLELGSAGADLQARELGVGQFAELVLDVAGWRRQREDATGTTLLRTGPDGIITPTTDGEQFARDVVPVLGTLAQ